MSNSWRIRCDCGEQSGYTQWGGAIPLITAIRNTRVLHQVLSSEMGEFIESVTTSPTTYEGQDYITFAAWHYGHRLRVFDEYGYEYDNQTGERMADE